ncbi:hypothetical protein phiAS5_ORF0062 [Aeromonas phage phiAS5]|uniref:Uncharacterized protein n=1 Tax=Aeromonas phage phiAS5 TaxID=879630 RepID=E1A2F9_9CAUD|nr:hypothetical protein phiAS5_ORF0062 [Aeromonas phage phiAS5]ADM79905.1 hypothetical protein phiAS5_ORF0062 [Aeromonas phage phiAS5]BES53325.1 hypothetical protein [Aeromonas phage phiWae14]
MTYDDFKDNINKLLPVIASEFAKHGAQMQVTEVRKDEVMIEAFQPIVMPNGIKTVKQHIFTVWHNNDKMEWCIGRLPQHPPKDIN